MKNTRLARGTFFRLAPLALLAVLSFCGASFAGNLEQKGFASLSGYTQLTNFDMDQNGDLYVIKDSKTNPRLARIDTAGTQLGTFTAAANAKNLTVAPSGAAAFYRTSDEPDKIWRVDLTNNTQTFKSGLTSNGTPVGVETIEAVSDTEVLVSWTSEYQANAAYPNWLPRTVKVGKFSFSGTSEPAQTWTWTPQWETDEVNFDGDPETNRLGNSWGYYLSYNPAAQKIGIYTVHLEKSTDEENERNRYAAAVTHLYKDDGAVIAEIPRAALSGWNASMEPYFTSTGVLMYRALGGQGNAPFPARLYLADQAAYAPRSDDYVESWQNASGQTASLTDLWSFPPEAHAEVVIYTFIDYRQHVTVVCGTRDIETGEAISTQLAMFEVPEPTPQPDPDDPDYLLTTGTTADETLFGTASADKLLGLAGNDVLSGGAGNDKIDGGDGDDIIWGGAGDDQIIGGKGNDTFIWNPGDGSDTITDSEGYNLLQFGAGVSPWAVDVVQDGDDLWLVIGVTNNHICLKDWFGSQENRPIEILFPDGTSWLSDDVNDRLPAPLTRVATEGDDILTGTAGDDALDGLGGNDTITGGQGNDDLRGGAGNDTFVWHLGDGSDRILDFEGGNKLLFGNGVTPGMVNVTLDERDLIFTTGGETIRVSGWLDDAANRLNSVGFAGGTAWNMGDIAAKLSLTFGTESYDTMVGTAGDDVLVGKAGHDVLSGGAGDDTLAGGPGNDRIRGDGGNDTLIGGPGDDYLEDNGERNIFIWNPGDGNDTIFNYKSLASYTSTLKIGEGTDPTDVRFTRVGNSLGIMLGNGGTVTVKEWYINPGGNYQLTEMRFADGTVWTRQNINDIAAGIIPAFRNAPPQDRAPAAQPAAESGGGSGGCSAGAGMAFAVLLLPIFTRGGRKQG